MKGQIKRIDKVHFRKFKNSEVIAIFPEIKWTLDGQVASYMRIGQHGGASKELINDLDVTTPEEREELYNELIKIGYNLNVIL